MNGLQVLQAPRVKRVSHVVAAAIVLAAAAGSVTAQLTGISMTVSGVDPEGSWALQQDNIFLHMVSSSVQLRNFRHATSSIPSPQVHPSR